MLAAPVRADHDAFRAFAVGPRQANGIIACFAAAFPDAARPHSNFPAEPTTMTALLIDGNALSKTLRAQAAERAAALTARGHQPGLAVILVGDNPASEVYVRNKIKACEDNGFFSQKDTYPATLSEADLLAR
ncbi:bifunctional methylenetetrahydrofolate dehydrogenase/methenyltetrahydrofolate cyclohydrolase, partial [Burkholderia multivorans]